MQSNLLYLYRPLSVRLFIHKIVTKRKFLILFVINIDYIIHINGLRVINYYKDCFLNI